MARMSVSMTLDAVRARQKTVTRRHVDTWRNLAPGVELDLIEKGMGLPKGAKQVVVARVVVTDVRVEPLHLVDEHEIELEGCAHMGLFPGEWQVWWAEGHRYRWSTQSEFMAIECRRIEWRYLDDQGPVR